MPARSVGPQCTTLRLTDSDDSIAPFVVTLFTSSIPHAVSNRYCSTSPAQDVGRSLVRVRRITQAVAKEVEGQHDHDHGERGQQQPRIKRDDIDILSFV
jgi:hypothetical protein